MDDIAAKDQDRARIAEPAEVRTPAANMETREVRMMTATTNTTKERTLTSLLTTKSKAFNEAVVFFRSRPVLVETTSNRR